MEQCNPTQRKTGSSPSLVETKPETFCMHACMQQQQQQQQKNGKFKGNWTRSFKHGCSRGKLLHEYPSGSLHMDSRRDPAVLLLIKTVVITFSILLEPGLCGATARHAVNMSSWLTGSTPLGCKGPSPPCAEGESSGEYGAGERWGCFCLTHQAQTRAPSSVENLP